MASPRFLFFSQFRQTLERVFTDRFQDPEPLLGLSAGQVAEEALIRQRSDAIK